MLAELAKSRNDPFWHYGLGLSDTYVFDTGSGMRHFLIGSMVFTLKECSELII